MDTVKKYCRIILNIIIPIVFLYFICVWGPRLLNFFLPFVIGWVIAVIANPLVRLLEKRLRIVRKHSSVLIVVAVLALIIAAFYFLITKLISEAAGFIEDIPFYYDSAWIEVQKILLIAEDLLRFLPGGIQSSVNLFITHIGEYLNVMVQKIASPTFMAAGNVVKSIPAALVYIVVTIFSSYIFIVDRDKILTILKRYLPRGFSRYYDYLKKDVKHLVGGYFLAQFKIMFVIAGVLAAGFLILGVKYALLIAVIIALLDFLPILGTGTILIPWAFLRIVSGEYAFGVGLIVIYVLTLVLRQIIQPKIVGDTMGLDPLMTLLFLYLGFKISGIAGMILAVPIGMLLINLYKFGSFDRFLYSLKTLIYDLDAFRKEDETDKKK
ncbi:sporulation integral membrane protein YtvI [Clostridium boliviensis]|uniref:Sporulation integral membrane protein YtvI n=1 Tax=Clostridium boliviensis TaxID=318465 RepID=A0ABU4GGU1_9CLOT|nr:sporulation integral membrane protein YtvI [Clostridium boliviensis]MDW2796237.1 sporulation integral membrane protein YtvI [Clostridium boliviensis]